jgi:N-acetylmuramoyl-L-alanine amidase
MVTLAAAAVVLAGCGPATQELAKVADPAVTSPAAAVAPTSTVAVAPTTATSTATAPTTTSSTTTSAAHSPSSTAQPARRAATVVLDPGHNGGNAAHPEVINQQVPAGRGRTKPCNTTGTATDAGYSEHAFAWDVSVRVRDLLAAQGIRVIMTRPDDTGVGPCVDRRAAIGNAAGADAVVSIHADGAAADGRGFHVAYSDPPLNGSQGTPSTSLASTVRDALHGGGFTPSTYIGSGGLDGRDDLAGLNLSQRPAVLIECANMRNGAEAAVVSSAAGRARYAAAIAGGVLAWLARRP